MTSFPERAVQAMMIGPTAFCVSKDTSEAIETGSANGERAWRVPAISFAQEKNYKVLVSRWVDLETETRSVQFEPRQGYFTIAVAMRKTRLRFSMSETVCHDGTVMSGMIHVSRPGQAIDALFRGPCEFLHIYISEEVMEACFQQVKGRASSDEISFERAFFKDSMIEQLALNLQNLESSSVIVGNFYLHAISLAIATRLITTRYNRSQSENRPRISPLTNWRLKRATDYIDDHIDDNIALSDIAGATGLTRMYFAAQFRAATGLRPREYVLRRRIERAQEMLRVPGTSLLDVTFNVGFQTQAHFTTVFKKYVGQTPHLWREAKAREKSDVDSFASARGNVARE